MDGVRVSRVERIGDATLYLADCREMLPGLLVDAVVTDPPYGLNFRGEAWDENIPDWLPAAREVASVVVFTTAPTTMWEYPRPDWVCNWYRPASSARALGGGFNHWSPILVYGPAKFPVDCLNLHAIKHAQASGFDHPSPKPIELMRWLVECATTYDAEPPGRSVLDPFMGSGTTGIACVQLGRQFIGIEIDPRYFDIACRRIEAATREPRLNLEPARKPIQEAML